MIVFLLMVFVQILLDPTYCACQTREGRLLLIFHHFANIGLQWGSVFFGHHRLHLAVIVLSIGLHVYLKGCFLTKINHRLCKIDTNQHTMITFTNHVMDLMKSDAHRVVYYTLAFLAAVYDLYFILR